MMNVEERSLTGGWQVNGEKCLMKCFDHMCMRMRIGKQGEWRRADGPTGTRFFTLWRFGSAKESVLQDTCASCSSLLPLPPLVNGRRISRRYSP